MRISTRHAVRTAQVLSVTVTAALVATGCGRSEDSGPAKDAPAEIGAGKAKGTVVMWNMGDIEPALKDLAAKFEQENPDVDVKITAVPWDGAHDKLTTAIAGGNTPDMSTIGSTWMAEMAAMNGFQATPTSIKSSDFYPGQWDTTKYKDTSYGVPFTADTTGAKLSRSASKGSTSAVPSCSTTGLGSSTRPRSSPPGANTSPTPVMSSAVGSPIPFTICTARFSPKYIAAESALRAAGRSIVHQARCPSRSRRKKGVPRS